MPLSGRDAVVLCVLVCCVPVQYWLTQRSSITPDQRAIEMYRLVKQAHTLSQKWLTSSSWREWLIGVQQKYMVNDYSHWYNLDDDDPLGECPAVEVWNYRNPDGAFGMSPKPRNIRPQGLKWRIGQVVKHNLWGYKAVIIGWDPKSKAPEEWISKMHQDNKHWKEQPNYALLVDTGDREAAQITYVPQENISPILNHEVKHPDLNQYFDFYDGAQYIPGPWLRAIYPRD
ncbi:uncharacterized protein [Procambarus clarkii]|nr:uncharacterized protein LOC123768723 isoform X2 [Procambarus clarkii]XP_045615385.1 uncharacterized protein LOC123768723 isoform X2 [Procambarus clarkii]XP_045615386.1 uncharacterized protein LOC123768723 isoform X2 [Procambarus clarkii]XP_045615387.1 uncharacterized protein LOC123768723 isoform X2 [Procambarus clarkii]XP_045615388.1 uncharacterized protein LOC123768723 isoform X2 [Procambarus clarkii]XP_045615390.1 uncharacterized protein LOC123768723 isoform X2 [Procambarus clarkii]